MGREIKAPYSWQQEASDATLHIMIRVTHVKSSIVVSQQKSNCQKYLNQILLSQHILSVIIYFQLKQFSNVIQTEGGFVPSIGSLI